jgi:hypothetical protein
MLPEVKTVETSKGKVRIYDLTLGYIAGIESGTVDDTAFNTVIDGTDLNEESIMEFRSSDIELLSKEILRLTYPEAFDENGELLSLTEEEVADNSKKKV